MNQRKRKLKKVNKYFLYWYACICAIEDNIKGGKKREGNVKKGKFISRMYAGVLLVILGNKKNGSKDKKGNILRHGKGCDNKENESSYGEIETNSDSGRYICVTICQYKVCKIFR